MSTAQSAFLLTWNPKHYSLVKRTGGADEAQPYSEGDEIRWTCGSKQPRVGDTVYLVRVGEEPRGIVARGIVTRESYLDADWLEPEKQRQYIGFRFDDIRQNCEDGLLPMMMLEQLYPEQKWSPQSSGIAINQQYLEDLSQQWTASSGYHSIETLLFWIKGTISVGVQSWLEHYRETCNFLASLQGSDSIDEVALRKIWCDKSNGIASVGNGSLYKADFEKNKPLLEKLALDIIADPSPAMLETVYQTWNDEKEKGQFKRNNWAVINRVFAAVDPQHVISTVDSRSLQRIIMELKKQFLLPLSRSGNWVEDNHNLLNSLSPLLKRPWDSYELSTTLWGFYQKVSASAQSSEQPLGVVAPNNPVDEEYSPEVTEVMAGSNTIYYGPPGTGKTYHVVEAAVRAAEPEFTDFGNREYLKTTYDQLVKQGRIRFVTFHQSYSYEEFVEGLRANTDDTGQVCYAIESGIFKPAVPALY